LAKPNADEFTNIRTIIESLGNYVATPYEATSRLVLKGKDNVSVLAALLTLWPISNTSQVLLKRMLIY